MAGYNDTKAMIISTLMGRPAGTEIQPENQQAYELNMLDYIRSLELISSSPIIGVADETTTPVQPDDARVSYIAGIAQNRTVTFQNFIGQDGQPLSITTSDMEAYLVILLWNAQYWTMQAIPTNIVSSAENANFYYNYNIRKTYASVASMNSDSDNPIGTDGKPIAVGDIVSVVNTMDSSENAIYSRTKEGWEFQTGMNFSLVQEMGDSPNEAMSQAATTKELRKIENENNSSLGNNNNINEARKNALLRYNEKIYKINTDIKKILNSSHQNVIYQNTFFYVNDTLYKANKTLNQYLNNTKYNIGDCFIVFDKAYKLTKTLCENFSSTETYSVGNIVYMNTKTYIANQEVSAGNFDAKKWNIFVWTNELLLQYCTEASTEDIIDYTQATTVEQDEIIQSAQLTSLKDNFNDNEYGYFDVEFKRGEIISIFRKGETVNLNSLRNTQVTTHSYFSFEINKGDKYIFYIPYNSIVAVLDTSNKVLTSYSNFDYFNGKYIEITEDEAVTIAGNVYKASEYHDLEIKKYGYKSKRKTLQNYPEGYERIVYLRSYQELASISDYGEKTVFCLLQDLKTIDLSAANYQRKILVPKNSILDFNGYSVTFESPFSRFISPFDYEDGENYDSYPILYFNDNKVSAINVVQMSNSVIGIKGMFRVKDDILIPSKLFSYRFGNPAFASFVNTKWIFDDNFSFTSFVDDDLGIPSNVVVTGILNIPTNANIKIAGNNVVINYLDVIGKSLTISKIDKYNYGICYIDIIGIRYKGDNLSINLGTHTGDLICSKILYNTSEQTAETGQFISIGNFFNTKILRNKVNTCGRFIVVRAGSGCEIAYNYTDYVKVLGICSSSMNASAEQSKSPYAWITENVNIHNNYIGYCGEEAYSLDNFGSVNSYFTIVEIVNDADKNKAYIKFRDDETEDRINTFINGSTAISLTKGRAYKYSKLRKLQKADDREGEYLAEFDRFYFSLASNGDVYTIGIFNYNISIHDNIGFNVGTGLCLTNVIKLHAYNNVFKGNSAWGYALSYFSSSMGSEKNLCNPCIDCVVDCNSFDMETALGHYFSFLSNPVSESNKEKFPDIIEHALYNIQMNKNHITGFLGFVNIGDSTNLNDNILRGEKIWLTNNIVRRYICIKDLKDVYINNNQVIADGSIEYMENEVRTVIRGSFFISRSKNIYGNNNCFNLGCIIDKLSNSYIKNNQFGKASIEGGTLDGQTMFLKITNSDKVVVKDNVNNTEIDKIIESSNIDYSEPNFENN